MTELIVPLTFWYKDSYKTACQDITCIVISQDKHTIATGSSCGSICMWTLKEISSVHVENSSSLETVSILQENSSKKSTCAFIPNGDLPPDEKDLNRTEKITASIQRDDDEQHNNEKSSDGNVDTSRQFPTTTVTCEDAIALKQILLGHRSPTTALINCNYVFRDALMSVSRDGTVCVWSYADGRCLASKEKLLKCVPTFAVVLPSGYHVAFCGNRTFIEIVNLKKLKISATLSSHQHWISTLYTCDLRLGQERNPMLLSAGVDGVIQFWSLRKGEMELPLQTLCLEISEPLSVALSPTCQTLLIVTLHEWIVSECYLLCILSMTMTLL
jgi:WD40 repeat protein